MGPYARPLIIMAKVILEQRRLLPTDRIGHEIVGPRCNFFIPIYYDEMSSIEFPIALPDNSNADWMSGLDFPCNGIEIQRDAAIAVRITPLLRIVVVGDAQRGRQIPVYIA